VRSSLACVVLVLHPLFAAAQASQGETATPDTGPDAGEETRAAPGDSTPAPTTPAPAAPETLVLPTPPMLGLGPQGFFLGTVPSGFQLRLRGVVQVDGRSYIDEPSPPPVDTFLIRRARPIIEGAVADRVDFRLMPDFGQGKAILFDAFLDVRIAPWLKIRAGKFKTPFGIERLQEEQNLLFIERGVPNNLIPDRDIGIAVHGDIGGELLSYELGAVNGVPDNATSEPDVDADSHKDTMARVFIKPLSALGIKPLSNIGAGFATTFGSESGTQSNTLLSSYVTGGQVSVFSYRIDSAGINSVVAAGQHVRFSPQLSAYVGPFGVLAEWVYDSQAVRLGSQSATLIHHAAQVEASVVLTGEDASYAGPVSDRPFSPLLHGWGIYELAARYGELDLDPRTFPIFADPTKSVQRIRAWAVGINAHFTRNLKVAVNFERSIFENAGTTSRAPDNALFGRFQVKF
jgi:phosphate-selective porin OprO and OprP